MLSKTFIPILNQNQLLKNHRVSINARQNWFPPRFFEKCILTFTTVFNRWENIARSTELIAGRVGNIIQNFRALNPTFCSCIVSQIRNTIWSAVYFCRWNICLPCYSKEEKEKNGGIWKSVSDQSCLLPLLFFFGCKNVRVSVFHSLEVRLIELQLSYSSNTMSNLAT